MFGHSGMRLTQPTGKIELDWRNPISRELAYALVGSMSGTYEAVSKRFMIPGVTRPGAGPVGVGPVSYGTSGVPERLMGATLPTGNGNYNGAYSFVVLAAPVNSTETTILQFGPGVGGTNFSQIALNKIYDTARPQSFSLWTYNGGDNGAASGQVFSWDGAPHVFVITHDESNLSRLYYDGIIRDEQYNSRYLAQSNSNLYFGGNSGTPILQVQPAVPLVLIFNRALTSDEVMSLTDKPWQLIKSDPRRIPVVNMGGSVEVPPAGDVFKYFNGTTVEYITGVKVYDGTAFITPAAKRWDGSTWVTIS